MQLYKPLRHDFLRAVRARPVLITAAQLRVRQLSHTMTQPTDNLAAWQMEAKGPLSVKENGISEPGPGEVRIKVGAVLVFRVDHRLKM